jgi:hypothetical protein
MVIPKSMHTNVQMLHCNNSIVPVLARRLNRCRVTQTLLCSTVCATH